MADRPHRRIIARMARMQLVFRTSEDLNDVWTKDADFLRLRVTIRGQFRHVHGPGADILWHDQSMVSLAIAIARRSDSCSPATSSISSPLCNREIGPYVFVCTHFARSGDPALKLVSVDGVSTVERPGGHSRNIFFKRRNTSKKKKKMSCDSMTATRRTLRAITVMTRDV